MTPKDPHVLIEHMRICIKEINLFIQNISKKEFFVNNEKINAVVRSLEILGEAAKNLPVDFTKQYPSIPWKKIIGMRDVITHQYYRIDLDIIWGVIIEDLPILEKELKKIK